MRNNLLKISILLFFCALFLTFGLRGARVHANVGGIPGGQPLSRTGAPSELTCAIAACHIGSAVNSGGGTLTITGMPANYTLNQDYDITITLAQNGRSRFGFQATVIDETGKEAGTITVTDSRISQPASGVVGGNPRRYISHTFSGGAGSNQISWTFRWKAPATAVGRITVYAAGNAANGTGDQSGDLIYTRNASAEAPVAIASVATVSSASFVQNVALAQNMIVSAFSTAALSQNVVIASTNPLPTILDGTEIEVRDFTSTSRKAGLFFVAPSQINYWIPSGTPNGIATISVKRNGSVVAESTITIETVSPGLFTANASGIGVPAAVALRVVGTTQTFESIFTTQNGQPVATALNITNGDLYLIGFGTGIVGAQASSISATIGGTATPILGVAAAPGFVGLDQVNIGPIPKSLAGRGIVNVVLTVSGKIANTVTINIQ
ncbi:MAG: choice-of-anchor V domain-containing protein [Blastocatellia bacterium]